MKKKAPNEDNEINASPKSDKDPLNHAGTVNGINEEDKEEFKDRQRNSKKAAKEEDEQLEIRKANRISDSGVRDDDDDGTDALVDDDIDEV